MRVTGANVLVKKISDKLSGGLFIPAIGNMGYCYVEVIAAGPGAYHLPSDHHIPMQVKVGDRTLVNQGVMEEYEYKDKDGNKQTVYFVPSVECTMILEDGEEI